MNIKTSYLISLLCFINCEKASRPTENLLFGATNSPQTLNNITDVKDIFGKHNISKSEQAVESGIKNTKNKENNNPDYNIPYEEITLYNNKKETKNLVNANQEKELEEYITNELVKSNLKANDSFETKANEYLNNNINIGETELKNNDKKLIDKIIFLYQEIKSKPSSNNIYTEAEQNYLYKKNSEILLNNFYKFYTKNRCMLTHFSNTILKKLQKQRDSIVELIESYDKSNNEADFYMNYLSEFLFPILNLNPKLKNQLDMDFFNPLAAIFDLVDEENKDKSNEINMDKTFEFNNGLDCYKNY